MSLSERERYKGFWERQGFSPVAVNFIVLAFLFFLYQIVGGVIAFFLAGGMITDENVVRHRFFQTLFQFLFLALPTLWLVGLHTGYFSPTNRENQDYLALRQPISRGVMVWGMLGAIVLNPFLSYVGDVQVVVLSEGFGLREAVRQWKELFDDVVEKLASAKSIGELIVVVGVVALTPAVCEELVFRGLLQRNFSRSMSAVGTVIWTGAIFGIYHLNPIQTLPLIAIGIYISYLRQSSGALWLCVAAHFAFNFFSVLGIFILNNADWFGLSEVAVHSLRTSEPELLSPIAIASAAASLGLFVVVVQRYQRALDKVSGDKNEEEMFNKNNQTDSERQETDH
jgi:membrane protease YdiL (CAAX protease family)